ncbi:FtsK/SpoIIIE domain-containing protein [Streptomyces sp. MB09-02B]|uniref:FtsK/SpoIIIE domain-containing protein n=1 Tax=Streptomyces sp. MB09-02B TaxID=3028667 RepID=UPI0029BABD72|nr:FtsK/SpoIIIE domain-containing protein [Streptomyces sp. MB09-02B]MDX3642767.1 FtsK/SpoIIIE domain-containing protein [Streptomyces sp. MB09-02B]
MKLLITTVDGGDSRGSQDVLLTASGSTPVEDVAAHLTRLRAGDPDETGDPSPAHGPAPACFLGDEPLAPGTPLSATRLMDGSVVALGRPQAPTATAYGPERDAMPQPHRLDHAPVVELQVVGGPDAGRVYLLGLGTHGIGPQEDAAVPLEGRGLPADGIRVTVRPDGSAVVELREGGPARLSVPEPPEHRGRPDTPLLPLAEQDEDDEADTEDAPEDLALPDGWQPWAVGAELSVGEYLLRLTEPTPRDAAVVPSEGGGGLDYNRPPRILPHLAPERFRLPGPPDPPARRPIPLMVSLAPMVFGVVMMLFWNSYFYLIFMFLSPVLIAANYVSGRRQARKDYEERSRVYRQRRASLEEDVREKVATERRLRTESAPDPAIAGLWAVGPGRRLWERRRGDPDHLALRIGTAPQPSLLGIDDTAREDNHTAVHWTIPDAPVSVGLVDSGVVGLAGTPGPVQALARWMTAQAAILHTPRDLRIVVLTDKGSEASWNWARWLPHSRDGLPGTRGGAVTLIGNDPETVANRVAELVSTLRTRQRAAESTMSKALLSEPDVLVVMDGARRLRDVPGVVSILKEGPGVRIFPLCLDQEERLLPEECTAVVRHENHRLTLRRTGQPDITDIRPDLVEPDWCERAARGIAPIRDVTPDASEGLPTEVGLLQLLGLPQPDAELITARWSRRPASTGVLLGAGYDGPVAFDLVKDGPHGLVAGTTGSGKSELLQTFVACLAALNRPDELTFVLVDYKGGSAFKDCVDLPHTLGMVTDLDSHLVQRALTSLSAELTRREHLLAEAGAKDLPEYQGMRRRTPELPPVPRLVIVIDEFATLYREIPDFIPGLVSIAQRGRSLGIHLILATQRPAGVVSSDIRANTNLRIALRVTDSSESMDVIDTKDAVSISPATPGRALARLGHGTVVPFQTAYAGTLRPVAKPSAETRARQERQAAEEARIWGTALHWQRLGRAVARPGSPEDAQDTDPVDLSADEAPTDLNALVEALSEAARLADCAPQPSPWLPALGQQLLIDDLPQPDESGGARLAPVSWALSDLPEAQAQPPVRLDLAEFGHLYVIGVPRSGRSQVLRTMAGALARAHSSADVHLYGIDFAGGALTALGVLPNTGAVVPRGDIERLERLFTRLDTDLERRQELLTRHHAGNLTELRALVGAGDRPAHVMLFIDGWDALIEAVADHNGGRLVEQVNRLLREGAAAGIHVVATSERALLSGRATALNDNKLLLRLNDRTDYHAVGKRARDIPDLVLPGRGFTSDGGTEIQVALLAPGAGGQEQAEALRRIGAEADRRDAKVPADRRPARIGTLPVKVTFTDAYEKVAEQLRRPMWGLLGLGGDDVSPVGVDFADTSPTFSVVGPPGSGRSTTLAALAVSLLASGTRLVVLAPRESPLRTLGDHPGVRLITATEPTVEEFTEALEAGGGPRVVVVDDADLFVLPDIDQNLRSVAQSGRDHGIGIVVAATAETMTGAMGWLGALKRHRKGVLLGPQSILEGDFIGARLAHAHLRGRKLGRARTVDHRTGELINVQIPHTVLDADDTTA